MKRKLKYKSYIAKPRKVAARILLDNEEVRCYNGWRIGKVGDYVVCDEYDRVMIMRADRFRNAYEEFKDEGQIHTVGDGHSQAV